MAHILLLFARSANCELISERLTQHHEVTVGDCNSRERVCQQLAHPFDLCIVDGQTLEQLWQPIQERRAAEEPILLPFLLIVAREKMDLIQRQLWQVIEEVVTAPIETAELQARVEILLRTRQYSLDLQQSNTQLQAANAELQEINRLKSQFVSMVSHEFRNPLMTISGYLQLLESPNDSIPSAKKQEFFQHIHASVKRLTTLVDDILVIGRVGVGKLSFEPASLDLTAFCSNLIEEMKFGLDRPRSLVLRVEGEPPPTTCLDQKLLRHVLTNLISNAIKYSPDDAPVSITLLYKREQVSLEVQDQGIGIPPEEQARLCEAFHRASNVGRVAGTGLGLAISKQCIDLHGGQISITSEIDKGTRVEVTIPLLSHSNTI